MADAKIRLSVDGSSQVISEFSRVESKIGSLSAMADRAKSSLALLGVGLSIDQFAGISDQYTKFTSQLKISTNSEREYAQARADVMRISKVANAEMSNTGILYARISKSASDLNINQQKVADITEAVTLALKANAATQEESASVSLQFSQAFAQGVMNGEEFNAVMSGAQPLMQGLADSMGVPIGQLRAMSKEGKLTSQVLAEYLPKSLEKLRQDAAQIETIGGSITYLKNQVIEYIGVQSQQNGSAALLSGTIKILADNLNYVTAAAAGFTAIKISEKIVDIVTSTRANIIASNELAAAKGREAAATIAAAEANVAETTAKVAHLVETRAAIIAAREDAIAKLSVANASITSAQAQIQAATSAGALSAALAALRQGEISLAAAMQARALVTTELAILGQQQASVAAQATAATVAQASAQAGLGAASTAAAAGTGLLSRALGFLGGPIGVVTTLLGIGVTAWLAWGSGSKDSEEKAAAAVEASTEDIITGLDAQIKKLNERNALAESGLAKIAQSESEAAKKLASLRAQLTDAQTGQGQYANVNEIARIDIVRKLSEQYGTLYGKIQAANEAQRTLDANGKASTDLIEVRERLLGVNKQYLDDLTKLQTAREKNAIGEKEYIDLLGKLAIKTYDASKAGKDAAKAATAQGLSYDDLMRSIKEKIAVTELDITTQVKLTEGEKMLAKFKSDLATVTNNLTAKQKKEIEQALQLLIGKEKLNAETEKELKLAAERKAAHDTYIKGVDGSIEKINEEIAAEQEHIDKIGLTKYALNELDIARLESQIVAKTSAAADLMLAGASEDLSDRYLMEADQLRKLIALRRERFAKQGEYDQAQDEIKAASDASKQFAGELYQGLTDSLFRSFEKGGKIAATFWENLKNTAKTTVLKVAVQGIMGGVLGLGTVGQANAGQSAGNMLGNPTSLMSMGQSLWDGFASAGAASSGTFTSFALSSMGQSLGLSSTTAASAMAAEAAALTGSTIGTSATSGAVLTGAGSAGASVATAMPYVMAAIAAFQGVKSINGDYRIGGLSADAGALLGIAPRLFGMKEKEMGGQTVTGTLGTDNLMRNQAWSQDGGVFRSDRSGVWSYGLKDSVATTSDGKSYTDSKNVDSDKALLAVLNGGYAAVKTAATDFAKALGLNADEIAKRNDSLNLTLGKTKEENDKALAGVFSGVADSIASSLIPNIKSLQKEGETSAAAMARLATGLVGVNNTISAIGFDKMSSTVEGANAAQRLLDASGGMEKFATNAAYFSENFLSEAQKIKPSMDLVASTLADLGMTNIKTIEDFRLAVVGGKDASGNLVKGLDLTTEAGAKTYARMMDLAPQFKAVTDYAAELDAKLAATNSGIQDQIDALTKAGLSREEQRKLETVGMAASTKLLQERLYALQDEAEATAKAKEATDKLANTNANLQARIDSLTFAKLSEAEQRKLETAGMADSTLKLQERVYALEDEAAATAKVKEAADKLAETNANLQARIDSLTFAKLSESEQRKLETVGMADSTLKLQERIYALEDEAAATAKVKEAADKLANTNANLQARIDSLTFAKLSEAEQRKLETAGMADSTLKLQERVYALEDEAAATAKAKDAIEKLKATNATIKDQIDAIVKAALPLEEQRKLEVIGLDATTVALKKQLWALEDSERAMLDKAALEKQLLDDQVKAKQEAEASFTSWMNDVKAAFSKESGVFKDIISQFTDLARSMEAYAESLVMGPSALLSPEAQYLANKAKFESVSALAKTGDKDAIGQLKNVSDAFLESSRKYNASSQAYFDDLNKVKAAVADSTVAAYQQVDLAKLQLNLLEQQVAGLVDINDSVQTVAQILSGRAGAARESNLVGGMTAGEAASIAENVKSNLAANGGFDYLYSETLAGNADATRTLQLQMDRWASFGLDAAKMDELVGKDSLQKVLDLFNLRKENFVSSSLMSWDGKNRNLAFDKNGLFDGATDFAKIAEELKAKQAAYVFPPAYMPKPTSTGNLKYRPSAETLQAPLESEESKKLMREQNKLMGQILDQLKLGDGNNGNKLDAIKNGFGDIKRAADFAKARVPTS